MLIYFFTVLSIYFLLVLYPIYSNFTFYQRVDKKTESFIYALYIANKEDSSIKKLSETNIKIQIADLCTITQDDKGISVILDNVVLKLNDKTKNSLIKTFNDQYFAELISKNSEKLLKLASEKGLLK